MVRKHGARYFPRAFYQGRLPKWQFPQVTTFQLCNFPSGNFPKVMIGLWDVSGCNGNQALWLGWARGRAPRLEQAGGPSAAARTDLGSCRLKKCIFRNLPFGTIPLGSCHLRKCLLESTKHRKDDSHSICIAFFFR